MNSRLRASVRLVGWYITSEITTACRCVDAPSGSLGKGKDNTFRGRMVRAKVRWEFGTIVFGLLALSRTLLTVNVLVTFGEIGVVVRMIVRASAPKDARWT